MDQNVENLLNDFSKTEKQLIDVLSGIPKNFSSDKIHTKIEIEKYIEKVQKVQEIFEKYEQIAQNIENLIKSKDGSPVISEKIVGLREADGAQDAPKKLETSDIQDVSKKSKMNDAVVAANRKENSTDKKEEIVDVEVDEEGRVRQIKTKKTFKVKE